MDKPQTTDRKGPLKFTPIQSFVESSFFTKLADLKLNEFKLDSKRRPIRAFMTNPKRLSKFNDKPIVNLDYSSFDGENKSNTDNIWLNGHLYNVNTIEEFKLLDKLNLLKDWGKEIFNDIIGADHLEFKNIDRFFLLTFCDLKKYKFYYWFAFPALHSSWNILESYNNNEYELEIEEYIKQDNGDQFLQIIDGEIHRIKNIQLSKLGSFAYIDSSLNTDKTPSIQLKNYLFFLAAKGFEVIDLLIYRNNGSSYTLKLELDKNSFNINEIPKMTGWERTAQKKLGPKLADLGSLINPHQLADQAVDLNLKLMKWRIAPELNLNTIKSQRVLLLGAGTLGSYVSRTLMGWGVRKITFVDNGRVSYSNPVRQPLFGFKDCFSDKGQGEWKATRAAESLKEIFPGVDSEGISMEVPMIGHPVTDEVKQKKNFDDLNELFDAHDIIFLLMDSRESRWLPTLLGTAKDKLVINAALGFDSYLVMRHGNTQEPEKERLGCYYCNDVVAPNDSLSDRTLDQMCTVTRPGVASIASSLAVELLVSVLQHPEGRHAPYPSESLPKFGEVPHQIRGFLHNFLQTKLHAPNYKFCSACSDPVVSTFKQQGWQFIKNCLNDSKYLEEISGLKKVQEEAEKASQAMLDMADFEDDLEYGDEEIDNEWVS